MKDYKYLCKEQQRKTKPKAHHEKYKLISLVITFIIVFFVILTIETPLAQSNESVKSTEIIVVKGDTLWSIAKTHYPEARDIGKVVYYIQQFNNLDQSLLHPGQVLYIPDNL